jgi:UDP-N-acetylmuramate--alanine ligase
MADSYADCFHGADIVVITDVYASGTQKIDGVTGEMVSNAIVRAHSDVEVVWAPLRSDIVTAVTQRIKPGDICISMGCGDIETFPDDLRELRS